MRLQAGRSPIVVPFWRTKYGRELLIDAGWVSTWPDFEQGGGLHRLGFHDLLLVTNGRGLLGIDGQTHTVEPGTVVATGPQHVRQWLQGGVEGACIFFTEDFTSRTFADPQFLELFRYFRPGRPSATFGLGRVGITDYLQRFQVMQREIARLHGDVSHKLRAVLYDLLVQLDRAYRRQWGEAAVGSDPLIDRFRVEIDTRFRTHHRVADYAATLGLTPGHLNARCKARLRRTASGLIRDRVILEACRQLLHSDATIAAIAVTLGFGDPAYFTRFFTRETGRSPSAFRHDRH